MSHRAQRYNDSQPWDIDDLPRAIVELLPNRDKGSEEFASFVEDFQASHGLRPDGMLGPRTLSTMQKHFTTNEVNSDLVAGGERFKVGLKIIHGSPFQARARNKVPTRIDLHESVTNDPDIFDEDDTTERILRKRGLGVHLMVGPDGSIVQHNDLSEDMAAHVGKHNRSSIGIEIVGPYYPPARAPWTDVIRAPWAHKGRYVLPTMTQAETVWLLVEAIWDLSHERPDLLGVPPVHAGVYPDPDQAGRKRICMGRLPSRLQGRNEGVFAHGYTDHADAYFPALYVYLRSTGIPQIEAFETAREESIGARAYVRM